MIRLSAILAIAFGIVLAIGLTVFNWGDWQAWPLWSVGYLSAGVLVWGGLRTISHGSSRLLSAAWGFAAGIIYMGLTSELSLPGGTVAESRMIIAIAAMFAIAGAGLCMSLMRRPV